MTDVPVVVDPLHVPNRNGGERALQERDRMRSTSPMTSALPWRSAARPVADLRHLGCFSFLASKARQRSFDLGQSSSQGRKAVISNPFRNTSKDR